MGLRRTSTFIDPRDAAYLELLIGDKDPDSRKIGLQRLCKFYRLGFRLRQNERMVIHLMGLLHDQAPKVKRWALNALALAGTEANARAVVEAIQRNRNDPDILGAGVSALCALLPVEQARAELQKADLPIEGAVLMAAAQHSGHFHTELRVTRVRIDYAENAELRLAGILVGLGRAPENLFSLTLPNREIIGELNKHPDPIVAQYSVWATYENPTLSLKNLKLPLHDVESKPPNVRKYVYQLAAKDAQTACDNHEFLVAGSQDTSAEVRAGLAGGLRDIYFDGLDVLILDWFQDEAVEQVTYRLLEHMAKNAAYCREYKVPVLLAYEAASSNSMTRARLEAAARDTNLYTDMKRIQYDAEGRGLFDRPAQSSAQPAASTLELAQKAKVLIVTALPKEDAAIRATLDKSVSMGQRGDSNVYRLGTYVTGLQKRNVILASAGVGKLNAATVTTNALRTFPNIEQIVMVGIAGGCPNSKKAEEHVRLGDIVFSGHAGVIEYDFVKETRQGREIRSSPQRPSAALLHVANDLVTSGLMNERPWEDIISALVVKLGEEFARPSADQDVLYESEKVVAHPDARTRAFPRIHAGAIGTADTLLKNDVTRDELRDRFNVRAVEMEASGLQNAAWSFGKDVFVIRGICDYCDEHKNDVWQNYAALVAAAYCRAVVETMPFEWF